MDRHVHRLFPDGRPLPRLRAQSPGPHHPPRGASPPPGTPPPADRAHIDELTVPQLIALRFASDAELPDLAHRALTKNMDPKAIKQAIVNWRPDNRRI
ncbi:DUF6526 family protein [Tunturiibacter empetritectus]|uniref:DUF6526 family protein n=1 Tax=Tunturiibacter empetritectus TaxID=3069691 RepID=UPI003D9AD9D9